MCAALWRSHAPRRAHPLQDDLRDQVEALRAALATAEAATAAARAEAEEAQRDNAWLRSESQARTAEAAAAQAALEKLQQTHMALVQEHARARGVEVCVCVHRVVAGEDCVVPSLLASSERLWCGGVVELGCVECLC